MTVASVHIKDVLVASGYSFAGVADWAIYIGKMPATPDRVITIYDAPGRNPDAAWLIDYPAVQIKVRGDVNDYIAAGNVITEIRNRLIGRPSFDALDGSGDRIVSITGIGDISFLDWGENNKPTWVANLSLIIEPAATTGAQREPLPL